MPGSSDLTLWSISRVDQSTRGLVPGTIQALRVVPLQVPECWLSTRPGNTAFRGSSAVEQPAVNRLVVGSNPTRGANDLVGTIGPQGPYPGTA